MTKIWGGKSRFSKNGGGKEYQVVGNLIHPWNKAEMMAELSNLPTLLKKSEVAEESLMILLHQAVNSPPPCFQVLVN